MVTLPIPSVNFTVQHYKCLIETLRCKYNCQNAHRKHIESLEVDKCFVQSQHTYMKYNESVKINTFLCAWKSPMTENHHINFRHSEISKMIV